MRFMLTRATVLRAVDRAHCKRSIYIRDELRQLHARAVAEGAKGHPPTSHQVLKRLRDLQRDGYLTCSRYPDGMYGYTWTMTDKARERLALTA